MFGHPPPHPNGVFNKDGENLNNNKSEKSVKTQSSNLTDPTASQNPDEDDEYFESDSESTESDNNTKEKEADTKKDDDTNEEEIVDDDFDEKIFNPKYVEEDEFADKIFQYLNTPLRPSPRKAMNDSQLGHLKYDPSYKWLLKDLSLSNEKRVIDVTDMLKDEDVVKEKIAQSIEENKIENEEAKKLKKKSSRKKLLQENNDANDSFKIKSDDSIVDNELKDMAGESSTETTSPMNTKNSAINKNNNKKDNSIIDEDKNYIDRLYENLLASNKNNNKDDTNIEEDFENISGDPSDSKLYDKWSRTHRKNNEKERSPADSVKIENLNEEDEESFNETRKKSSRPNSSNGGGKFSKSFEVSLDDLDEMINRVDNGIKLKRNKDNANQSNRSQSNIDVDSLKKEWTDMFNKLESDYKQKLEEQQKINDQKLKSLHEDIKQSIMDQQDKILAKQQLLEFQQSTSNKKDDIPIFNQNETLNETIESLKASSIPIISNSNINSVGSVVDNAKYISNLRLELKTKHARHIQDLKEYYEKEIDELSKKLDYYKSINEKQKNDKKARSNGGSSSEYDYVEDFEMNGKLYENLTKTNEEYLKLNNDLNNANSKLLDKLVCFLAYFILVLFYAIIIINT